MPHGTHTHLRRSPFQIKLHRHAKFDRVVGRVNEVLSGAQVSFGGLNGSVAEEQLDLFKLATCGPAQLRAGPAIMPRAA